MFRILKHRYKIYGISFLKAIFLSEINTFCNFFLMIMATTLIAKIQKSGFVNVKETIIICICIYIFKIYISIFMDKIIDSFRINDQDFYVDMSTSITRLSQETLENKDFQNKVNLARQMKRDDFKITKNLINSYSNITMTILIGIFLVYKIPLSFVCLLALIFILYFFIKYQKKETAEIWVKYQNNARKEREYHQILIDHTHCYERNLFNFFTLINRKYEYFSKDGIEKNKKEGKKRFVLDTLFSLITIIFVTIIILLSISTLFKGNIILPQVFIIISFALLFSKIIRDELYKNYDYKNYCLSLDAVEEILCKTNTFNGKGVDIEEPVNKIELKDLWFKYKGSDKFVVKGLNYIFDYNKTYALLGKNGTGKSTLIKLITGLYKPTKGSVLINGKNAYELSNEERKQIFGVLFQNPCKYPVSIKENIAFDRDICIEGILEKELMDTINGFKNGVNSSVSPFDENPVTLSGGQWQKIFFSRLKVEDSSILILDEPTSHLDPLSELDFYNQFKSLSNNKINIFISHRMGIINFADRILIMNEGEIVEDGTAEDLYEKGGLFNEMYNEQKFSYIKG